MCCRLVAFAHLHCLIQYLVRSVYCLAGLVLLLHRRGKLFGVECKRVDAPRITPSMHIALDDLGLERIAVIYPGTRRYALADRVEAVPIAALAEPGQLFGDKPEP